MTLGTTLRGFRRTPWFAATATLTIALGIGATVSIFSVVNRVLLAPLPYSDPERLVWIATWNAERGQYSKSSGYDFNVWKHRTEIFESVEAFWDRPYTVTGTTRPEGLVGCNLRLDFSRCWARRRPWAERSCPRMARRAGTTWWC